MVNKFKINKYKPLKLNELKKFIISKKNLKKLFKNTSNLMVKEVGDGNLNLVFFIENKVIKIKRLKGFKINQIILDR